MIVWIRRRRNVLEVNDTNLNEKLLREGYAEIMYTPPSEFDPHEWYLALNYCLL